MSNQIKMIIDDLFTRTTTDVSTLKKSVPSDFENLKSFNAACIDAGYDMLILFDDIHLYNLKNKDIKNFVDNFESYLDILCSDYSQCYIKKREKHFITAWWINHPVHFIDFLKLLKFIDKYVDNYFGPMTNVSTHLLTQENCDRSDNMRTVAPVIGRLFGFREISNIKEDIRYNITNDFTLFWNNLNQQTELFGQKYYGREIVSIADFVKLFSMFAAHATICLISKNDKDCAKFQNSKELRKFIALQLTEKFKH